jgi:hypothetical protein
MRSLLLGTALWSVLLSGACSAHIMAPETRCAEPAPLHGKKSPAAPGYIVVLHEGVDPHRTTWELAQQHGFTPISVFALGFAADFPESTREALRCEAVVRYVEHMVEPAPPPGTP